MAENLSIPEGYLGCPIPQHHRLSEKVVAVPWQDITSLPELL